MTNCLTQLIINCLKWSNVNLMKIDSKKLPNQPGVYLFKNKDKQVIYVGKAINLKNRVKSYFRKSADLVPDKKLMLAEIKKIDYIIVDNELEAIYLESNLIKKYHPKYNIILKDDKFFVYIKITKEKYPRVLLTRRIAKDQAKYFGPYLSARQAKRVLFTLRQIFPYRSCNILPKTTCLEYHLGNCNAPCIQAVSQREYQQEINNVVSFLRGQYQPIRQKLKKEMNKYSDQKQFEKAAKLRDQIISLQAVIEKQKIISPTKKDQDIVSLYQAKGQGVINLLQVRSGKLINSRNFTLDHLAFSQPQEIIPSFLKQYYQNSPDQPQEIITAYPIKNKDLPKISKAKFIYAQKGRKKRLIKMGRQNARDFWQRKQTAISQKEERAQKALAELAKKLKIKPPKRMEAYDIANIQGQNAVGSMVVFTEGQPAKSHYRKFAIKTYDSANDPGMLKEVLLRRFSPNNTWLKPDLVIVDGGKPQLSAARQALKERKQKTPVIALAKKLEKVYIPQKPQPLLLPKNSPALHLIQRIRDEAHRFATGFYRQKHQQKNIKSAFAGLVGIGPKRQKILKKEFSSPDKISRQDEKKLIKLLGKKTAQKLLQQLLGLY